MVGRPGSAAVPSKPRRDTPLRLVWGLLVAFFWLAWNPFGVMTKVDDAGQALLLNLLSPHYPDKRPPMAVVLANDDFVREFGGAWPLSYEAHAQVIDAMARRRPAAIFVDFAFVDERPDDPNFPEVVRALSEASVHSRILLAAAPTFDGEIPRARPELEALVASNLRVSFVSIAVNAADGKKGLYSLAPFEGSENAALALARLLKPDFTPPRGDTIQILWAPPFAPSCASLDGRNPCADFAPNVVVRAGRLLVSGLLPAIHAPQFGIPEPYRYTAYPVTALSPSALLRSDEAGGELAGAVVLYGGSFALAGDLTESYLYADLPGVFAHAMAADNLVSYARGPVRSSPPFQLTQAQHAGAIVALLWLVGVIGAVLTQRLPPPPRPWMPDAQDIAIAVGMTAIFAIELIWLRVAPGLTLGAFAALALRRLDFGLFDFIQRTIRALTPQQTKAAS